MKIFWWQAGVHVEPENKAERKWLYAMTQMLKRGDINIKEPTTPVPGFQSGDEKTVTRSNEARDVAT